MLRKLIINLVLIVTIGLIPISAYASKACKISNIVLNPSTDEDSYLLLPDVGHWYQDVLAYFGGSNPHVSSGEGKYVMYSSSTDLVENITRFQAGTYNATISTIKISEADFGVDSIYPSNDFERKLNSTPRRPNPFTDGIGSYFGGTVNQNTDPHLNGIYFLTTTRNSYIYIRYDAIQEEIIIDLNVNIDGVPFSSYSVPYKLNENEIYNFAFTLTPISIDTENSSTINIYINGNKIWERENVHHNFLARSFTRERALSGPGEIAYFFSRNTFTNPTGGAREHKPVEIAADPYLFMANPDNQYCDQDFDYSPDDLDNCVDVYNPLQEDSNGSGLGDACETDFDLDGLLNDFDNCPNTPNVSQEDLDLDETGDACDPDIDGDTINNDADNCPMHSNSNQYDFDSDGIGNLCDTPETFATFQARECHVPQSGAVEIEFDGEFENTYCIEGITDTPHHGLNSFIDKDSCEYVFGSWIDPTDITFFPCLETDSWPSIDIDGDGIINIEDPCFLDDTNSCTIVDQDNDTIADHMDNCVAVSNLDQLDTDSDSQFINGYGLLEGGDACDPDKDGDGINNDADNCPLINNPMQEDLDSDSIGDVCDNDVDNDTVLNAVDNCPLIQNIDQSDLDSDNIGDVCDDNIDGDSHFNAADNCPSTYNEDQADLDSDNIGDVCDTDIDGDSVSNDIDNCPLISNPDLANMDYDQYGDACDPDIDNDGLENQADNCPMIVNADQKDSDSDGVGDVCDNDIDGDSVLNDVDNCPLVSNADQLNMDADSEGDVCDFDLDNDGFDNDVDNCPAIVNADQANADSDAYGDVCDLDLDGDGYNNDLDNCPLIANSNQDDLDTDSIGDICDSDRDGDTHLNDTDNCPDFSNESQVDIDNDGIGDVCDPFIDSDLDGIDNANDNCPLHANVNQDDLDNDGIGNICDPDIDNDSVPNDLDNCPVDINPGQEDEDLDEEGDVCDFDIDNDGIDNLLDNCPQVINADQLNTDGDSKGDACDTDIDGDSVLNETDNCLLAPNSDQADIDYDSIGDVCDSDRDGDNVANQFDNCPIIPNANQIDIDYDLVGDACDPLIDTDRDNVGDDVDNCKLKSNSDQSDIDGDSEGDVCDDDIDGDSLRNLFDNCPKVANLDQTDTNGDGIGDACQLDEEAPTVKIYDGNKLVSNGGTISSPGNLVFKVSDNLDFTPNVTISVSQTSSDLSTVSFGNVDNRANDYLISSGVISPSVNPINFTFVTEDYSGNTATVNFNLQYKKPQTINIANGREVKLPAVSEIVRNLQGVGPVPFKITDSRYLKVTGTHNVYASLNPEAPSAISVDGQVINPGAKVLIASGVDLAANNQLDPSVAATGTNTPGKYELTFTTTHPRTPYFVAKLNLWKPEPVLKTSSSEYTMIAEPFYGDLSDSTRSCVLTTSIEKAKAANPFTSPYCYVEYTASLDNDINAADSSYIKFYGSFRGHGSASLDASISTYNPSTDSFIELDQKSTVFNVKDVLNYTHFKLNRNSADVLSYVDTISASLDNKGKACSIYLNRSDAISYSQQRAYTSRPACLVEWTNLPGSVVQDTNRNTPFVTGSIDATGINNISWKVVTFDSQGVEHLIEEQNFPLNVHAISPPALTFTAAKDNNTVTVSGGYLGALKSIGANGNTTIEVYKGSELISTRTYNRTFRGDSLNVTHRVNVGTTAMYSESSYTFKAFYEKAPHLFSEVQTNIVTVPDRKILPLITADTYQSLSTDLYPLQVSIVDMYKKDQPYDVNIMGNWEVRILNQVSYLKFDPLSDWNSTTNGKANFDLNLEGMSSRTLRLVAEARLIMPESSLEHVVKSQRATYVKVFNGSPIEASLSVGSVSSPAPYAAYFGLVLKDRYLQAAIGNVQWLVSKNAGVFEETESLTSSSLTRFNQRLLEGDYQVKAIITNKYSGSTYETPVVSVNAYNVPVLKFNSPTVTFLGDTVSIEALPTYGGEAVAADEVDIMWSEDKKNWATGNLIHDISVDGSEQVRKVVYARVRFKNAPDYENNPRATLERYQTVTFNPIREPSIKVTGPYRAEVGETYTWNTKVINPYNGMKNSTNGEFLLPDGSVVSGTSATYTVKDSDLDTDAGKMVVSYRGWVEGFKELGAEKTVNFSSRAWKYIWPQWNLYSRAQYTFAPTRLSLKALQQGAPVPIDDLNYAWDIPTENVTVVSDKYENIRELVLNEPGTYDVSVTFSDSRGNTTTKSKSIIVKEAPAFNLGYKLSKSNVFDREPLLTTLYANASGGHPADKISDVVFKVDGIVVPDYGTMSRNSLMAGDHTITISLESEMGEHVEVDVPVTVQANQAPACTIELKEYSTSWYYTARCDDPDGKVKAYSWLINGEDPGRNSVRIAVPKSSHSSQPTVQVIATDDSGAQSPPMVN